MKKSTREDIDAMATAVADAITRTVEGPKVGGRITTLEALIVAQGKQLEDMRTEVNYLRWVREQETAKVPR